MNTFHKIKATALFFLTALLVFSSCFGQKTSNEQNQTGVTDSIDIFSHFNSKVLERQAEFFKIGGFPIFRFRQQLRKMNLVATLDINKNDTIFIAQLMTQMSGSCVSIAFNSRHDILCDVRDEITHYDDIDFLRQLLQRWDKKEIEEKGKRKNRTFGDIGHWRISRVIVQPNSIMLDGIVIEVLPHTLTKEEIEWERQSQEIRQEIMERNERQRKLGNVMNAKEN